MVTYKRILLPLDSSSLAEQALPHAIALAKRFCAELILIKVLVPLASSLNLPPGAVKRSEAITKNIASEYLEKVTERIQTSIKVKPIIVTGRPHEEIIRFAESEQVDMVIMCTRGNSGISRWLLGSVEDRVTRSINVPVLLVQTQKEIGQK